MRKMRCSQFDIKKFGSIYNFFRIMIRERAIYQKLVLKNHKFADRFHDMSKILGKYSFFLYVNKPIDELNC